MSTKVALVCKRYHPYIGGIETHVKNIGEILANQGFDVDVLTLNTSKGLTNNECLNKVNIKRFKCWIQSNADSYSSSLHRYLSVNSKKYDIIHAHDYQALPALYAILSKNTNKIVFTPHYHSTGHNLSGKILRIPYSYIWSRYLHRADKIICVSDAEKNAFLKRFKIDDEKFIVIPNAVDFHGIRAANSQEMQKQTILYVGRIERYKNIQYIVEALKYLDEQYTFCIIGQGSFKTELQKYISSLGVQNKVNILSGLSNEEVYTWYKSCSIFVSLSNLEAFGITILEALAAGKSVIASDIPAYRELANKLSGIQNIKIPGTSPQELADIIRKSTNISTINNLDLYSWDKIVEEVRKVYKTILEY